MMISTFLIFWYLTLFGWPEAEAGESRTARGADGTTLPYPPLMSSHSCGYATPRFGGQNMRDGSGRWFRASLTSTPFSLPTASEPHTTPHLALWPSGPAQVPRQVRPPSVPGLRSHHPCRFESPHCDAPSTTTPACLQNLGPGLKGLRLEATMASSSSPYCWFSGLVGEMLSLGQRAHGGMDPPRSLQCVVDSKALLPRRLDRHPLRPEACGGGVTGEVRTVSPGGQAAASGGSGSGRCCRDRPARSRRRSQVLMCGLESSPQPPRCSLVRHLALTGRKRRERMSARVDLQGGNSCQ